MVTIIDKIRYLPKSTNSFIDENSILNMGVKEMVQRIKRIIDNVNLLNDPVTLTVTGSVSKQNKISFNCTINCDDEELKAKIEKAIHE